MSSKQFKVPIGLVNLPSDPASGNEGDIYYNNVSDSIRLYKNGAWTDLISTGNLPSGGATGQILAKSSNSDYAVEWIENYSDYTETLKHKVKNDGTRALYQGQPVYVTGSDGTNVLVGRSSNATEGSSSKTLGLLAQNLATNGQGFVISRGKLGGLDTSTAGSVGDPVWLGVDGALIYGLANKPYAPAHLVYIGVVTKKNNSTGEIFINPQNGFELEELHNVGIGYGITPADNEILAYDTTSGLWINQTSVEAGLIDTSETEQTKTGNLIIGGNLTVNGTTTTLNTENLRIEDNLITLNSNVTGSPSLNAGIEIERGTSDNVSIIWDESLDRWRLTGDGTNYYSIAVQNGWETPNAISITSSDGVNTGNISLNTYGNQISLSDSNGFIVRTDGSTKIFSFNNNGSITFPDNTVQETAFPGMSAYDTDDLSEGTTNKYFTDERAVSALTETLSDYLTISSAASTYQPTGTYLTPTSTNTVTNKTIGSGGLKFNNGGTDQTIYADGNDFTIYGNHTVYINTVTGDIDLQPAGSAKIWGNAIATQSWVTSQSYLTTTSAGNTYLTQTAAAANYLTQTSAASTYQPIGSYLTSESDPVFVAHAAYNVTSTKISHWDTAYSWGNHASAGYITSESDPIFTASPAHSITSTQISHWDTAYGWGNHSSAGYLTTSSAESTYAHIASPTFTGTVTSPILRLTGTTDVSLSSTNHAFQIGDSTAANIRVDINEILAVNNGANSTLNLQTDGGLVLLGNNVTDGTAAGLEVHGPLKFESSLSAANNSSQASMRAKVGLNSTADRQEFQIYAAGDAYSTGSLGAGIHLYGTDDRQHAGNITFLTGKPDNGDARMIIAGGTGTTGYVNNSTTYTRTNTDTRVTIGNALWDWVDTKQDTGLLNLKDASSRPAIFITSANATDGTTYGTIGIEPSQSFGIGHWSGTSYTDRLSIDANGVVTISATTQSTSKDTGSLVLQGGLGVEKNLYVGGNIDITGNFTVHGTTTTVSTSNIEVTDPLIYIATGNSANINDIGIVGHFNNGTYQHTGIVRDATDGKWKIFSGVSTEPSTTIDFTSAIYDTLKIGTLEVEDATTTRSNLGLGSMATESASSYLTTSDASSTYLTQTSASSTYLTQTSASSTYAPLVSPSFSGTVTGITKSMVGLGNVENTALSTWAGSSNITTLGTISAGTWEGNKVDYQYGGTGQSSLGTAGQVLAVNSTEDALEWVNQTGTGGGTGTSVQDTAPSNPNLGDTWFNNTESVLYIWDGSFWIEVNSLLTVELDDITELDNLSRHFDGTETRFLPTFNGDMVPITNPYRLLLTINGIIQEVGFPEYVWQSMLPKAGYRIDNEGYIAFSEAPPVGSTFNARIMAGPTTNTTKKIYAFEAADILLGA